MQSQELSGLPWWLSDIESSCQCRRHGSRSESGRSPGEGSGNSLQYSCLGNMDRGAWWATVHRVAKELDKTEQLNSNSGNL